MKSFRTILVVHQTPIIRKGIRTLLERQNTSTAIVYEADTFADASNLIKHLQFDALILDENAVSNPEHRKMLDCPFLLIYSEYPSELCESIRTSRKNGFLPVTTAGQDFLIAFEGLFSGAPQYITYIQNSRIAVNESHPSTAAEEEDGAFLTRREREVLELILKELSNEEIAEHLCLSRRTIEGHKQRLTRKLNVKSLVGLTRYGMRLGLL